MSDSIFSGITQAKPSYAGNYVRPGIYWARIDDAFQGKNRKEEAMAGLEMTVLHVISADLSEAHKPFESVTQMWMKKQDSFLPNIKAMLAVVCNADPNDIDVDICQQIFTKGNSPIQLFVVEFEARLIRTKAGNDFTKVVFKRVIPADELRRTLAPEVVARAFPDNTLDRVEAVRKTFASVS